MGNFLSEGRTLERVQITSSVRVNSVALRMVALDGLRKTAGIVVVVGEKGICPKVSAFRLQASGELGGILSDVAVYSVMNAAFMGEYYIRFSAVDVNRLIDFFAGKFESWKFGIEKFTKDGLNVID